MSKFSYILLGLVVTFSSFVLFTVHLGTTQAFVSAQTSIDLYLGIGFPDTELTDLFTIANAQNDTVDYKLTLEATGSGAEDIRPYLTVWKDPSENELDDEWVTGEYYGFGSFTKDDDTEDTWFITFDIPDVTLPS
ncbi:MAG TPA: hypothetical protein G4O15_08495, partial [Dehalococcoidia bacterium]|nr:hypothetical protein [Dehalococcoidia bacterium]